LNNIKVLQKDIEQFQPDVLIFIDYPINMRIAKWAKQKNIPTHYYIAANLQWKENRITSIKRDLINYM
jgi:lipid-A-disaccharide synthase